MVREGHGAWFQCWRVVKGLGFEDLHDEDTRHVSDIGLATSHFLRLVGNYCSEPVPEEATFLISEPAYYLSILPSRQRQLFPLPSPLTC